MLWCCHYKSCNNCAQDTEFYVMLLPKYLTLAYPLKSHLFLMFKFTMRILGFDPEVHSSRWLKLWALFNWILLFYGNYAELYFGIYNLSIDMPKSLDALCPGATSVMSLVKVSIFWWHRERIRRLIEQVRALTEAQKSPRKLRIKQQYYMLATRFPAVVMFFGLSTSTSYTLRPIIKIGMALLNSTDVVYETPFKMMFPARLLTMPIYPITFLLTHWHGYMTVLIFVGSSGLFFGSCLYFTVLLKCLQLDLIATLADRSVIPGAKPLAESEVTERLINIIERHNQIVFLVREFSSIMDIATLVHFIASSAIICMSIIDLLLFSGYGSALYVIYTIAFATELLLYCYGGTAVMKSSEELGTVAYSSCWYAQSVKVQKMVLLLIVRSQRTLLVKVPFFAPSLPVFMSILRFSGSLITLVKSFL